MKQALADALQRRGYTSLTPVQEAVNNPEYAEADLLVSAQTGSGKTVGFGIAISTTILADDEEVLPKASRPLALVVAPTRELAMQVKRELIWLYEDARATVASCVGGMDMRDERRTLERGAHIVVATPGRLVDHIKRGSIDLSGIKAVVLDEADEMLDLGFREDLEFILEEAPEGRQTLMFSATVPASITKLAKRYQRDAIRVNTKSEKGQHADIKYIGMTVAQQDSENAIINVLRFHEAPNAIVFCNTRGMVNRLTTRLSNRGFAVVALSGELSQNDRTHALQAMRDGRARVCVATDVAARGIDLPNLDLVVHAELPSNHETLLHRSGRTGRAGRKGTCAVITTTKSRRKAERILRDAKVEATWGPAPSAKDVKAEDLQRLMNSPDWQEPVEENQQETLAKIVETFSAEQIVAAYLRLYSAKHSAPEELSSVDVKPKARSEFGPSVWFSLSEGRAANADPRRILPMICNAGDITKGDVGAIRIQQNETFIEISKAKSGQFLKSLGSAMVIESGAKLRQLDSAPAIASSPRPGGRSGGPRNFGSNRDRDQSGRPGRPRRDDRPGDRRDDRPGDRRDDRRDDRKGAGGNKGWTPLQGDDRPAPKQTPRETTRETPRETPREASHEDGERVRKKKGTNPSLPTPKGKPNSKKNKARAAKAAQDPKS